MNLTEFRIEDYKMKVDFFTKHYSRVWVRFNFFLIIHSTSLGLLAKSIIDGNSVTKATIFVYAATNFVICLIWFIFGAQDRFLTILYRNQAHAAGELCAKCFNQDSYEPVGTTDCADPRTVPKTSLTQWRMSATSMTKLPALVPAGLLIAWAITLTVLGVLLWKAI